MSLRKEMANGHLCWQGALIGYDTGFQEREKTGDSTVVAENI